MAIDLISLRKLMQLMLAPERRRTGLLRADITSDLRRDRDGSGEGGDFHSPFWSDAKAYAAGALDLSQATAERIAAHEGRARLYPLLRDGFLRWWNDRRRRRNEPFVVTGQQIKGRLVLDNLGIVKVENNLGFSIGDDGYRVVYPYFCEDPDLTTEIARLGLWGMSQALLRYNVNDLRIFDVLRATSFSTTECPFRGSESEEFRHQYGVLLNRWLELRQEYR